MSRRVVYLPAAEDDVAASFANYEAESPGLGRRFTATVRDTVDREDERIVILAATHGRRQDQGWQRRR